MEVPVYHLDSVVHSRSALENFDGSLDLILQLLSKNKMEIQDIQISLILEQYLQWMEQQKSLNLDIASEFVAMASHLVYIKTKMLLSINAGKEVSEMEELVAALEQRQRSENYVRVKKLLPWFRARYEVGSECLTRGQLPITPDKTYRYQHESQDLIQSLIQVMRRSGEKPVPAEIAFRGIVGREPYPVEEKEREVLDLLKGGRVSMEELFQTSESRSEIVATFLAILELCRNHQICLTETEKGYTVARAQAQAQESP